jgi:hypothetical protein
MYEDRPGYPGHNTELAGGYSPKGSSNSYQMPGFWDLTYPKGRGRTDKGLQPHTRMLQDTGRRGGSGSVDVSLENLLKRWEIDVWVYPEGTPYGVYGFMAAGEHQTVRVGDLPGLREHLIERAAAAEPRRYRF